MAFNPVSYDDNGRVVNRLQSHFSINGAKWSALFRFDVDKNRAWDVGMTDSFHGLSWLASQRPRVSSDVLRAPPGHRHFAVSIELGPIKTGVCFMED